MNETQLVPPPCYRLKPALPSFLQENRRLFSQGKFKPIGYASGELLAFSEEKGFYLKKISNIFFAMLEKLAHFFGFLQQTSRSCVLSRINREISAMNYKFTSGTGKNQRSYIFQAVPVRFSSIGETIAFASSCFAVQDFHREIHSTKEINTADLEKKAKREAIRKKTSYILTKGEKKFLLFAKDSRKNFFAVRVQEPQISVVPASENNTSGIALKQDFKYSFFADEIIRIKSDFSIEEGSSLLNLKQSAITSSEKAQKILGSLYLIEEQDLSPCLNLTEKTYQAL